MAVDTPPLTLSDLKIESDLLHLLFHRNKNQHHSNKWWKWLGMLRRNIKKLLDPAGAAMVEERLEYLRRIVVPSCYTAFTGVVANRSFAPLGLALLGTLARIHRIVGPEKRGKELKEVVAEEEVIVAEEALEKQMVKKEGLVVGPLTIEDFGEALHREDFGDAIPRQELGEEGMVEEQEEILMVPEEKIVVEKKMEEAVMEREEEEEEDKEEFFPKATANKIISPINKEEQFTNNRTRKEGKASKKRRATKLAPISPSPQPRIPSPPLPPREEPLKKKSKRKSEDTEGVKKKKKRKKADEIDDLFAGLF